MTDDDDLPVLTQILRTGIGPLLPLIHREASADRAGTTAVDGIAPPAHAQHATPYSADVFVLPQDHSPDPSTGDDRHDASSTLEVPDFVVRRPDAAPVDDDGADGDRRPAPRSGALPLITSDYTAMPGTGHRTAAPGDAAAASHARDALTARLLERIGPELDARIAQALHAEVETALGQLQHNLRHELAVALRDVVDRALAEELRAPRDETSDPR